MKNISISVLLAGLIVASQALAGPGPVAIQESDVTFHHAEPDTPGGKAPTGACVYAISHFVARKHTLADTYARCHAGRWDEVIGRPRQGGDLWLIGKLPGPFDPLTIKPRFAGGNCQPGGDIELDLRSVSVTWASPLGQTEVLFTVKLGSLPPGRHQVRAKLTYWKATLDDQRQERLNPAKGISPVSLSDTFEVLPAIPACTDPIHAGKGSPARVRVDFLKRLYVGYGPSFTAAALIPGCKEPVRGAVYAMVNTPLAKAMEANDGLVLLLEPGQAKDKPKGAFVLFGDGPIRHFKVVGFSTEGSRHGGLPPKL